MTPSEVEQLIVEVLRRLTAEASSAACDEEPREPTSSLASIGGVSGMPIRTAEPKRKTESTKPEATTHELTLDDRLLTLAKVEGKLEGIRRLIVPRKAIVTPAVREELMRRGIELDRGVGAKRPTKPMLLVVIRFEAALKHEVRQALDATEEQSVRSLGELVEATKKQIGKPERMVLVLTKHTAAATCALNRLVGVRAAAVQSTEATREAVKGLATNVIVVDPARLARLQLVAVAREFVRLGLREVPSELRGIV